jgi:integrase
MAIYERKRKDGTITYLVRVLDPFGKWYPGETFEDRARALEREAELIRRNRQGKRSSNDARITKVSEYYPVWGSECRQKSSEGWKGSQDQMFRTHCEDLIGGKYLSQVTKAHVGRILNRMAEKGLAPQTRLHVYNLLSKMFEDAIEYFDMDLENPVVEKHHRPEVPETQVNFLEPEQAAKLLEVARDHYAGPVIWIETLAGLRTEATVPLVFRNVEWNHGDPNGGTFRITRYWKRKVKKLVDESKDGKPTLVPISPLLREYLWERWERSSQDLDALICEGPRGGMLDHGTYLKALTSLCAKAGVPRVTPHELRHSATEIWVEAGASQEDLRRLLNHSPGSSATQRYMHRTDRRLQGIAGKMHSLKLIQGNAPQLNETLTQSVRRGGSHSLEVERAGT